MWSLQRVRGLAKCGKCVATSSRTGSKLLSELNLGRNFLVLIQCKNRHGCKTIAVRKLVELSVIRGLTVSHFETNLVSGQKFSNEFTKLSGCDTPKVQICALVRELVL